ncbi:MAG: Helix-turn-helix domain [Blastocatellia bacterium]|jgi:transcriptional regulator with XRE-family HTH domain|nr:Helix-turn-helix domain [Blastocatellia bacterium]
MGLRQRPKPALLAPKLSQIRNALNLSQSEMLGVLGLATRSYRSVISGYELGTREPPLPVLLVYARAAGVCVDVLIDDNLKLPEKLPSIAKHKR